MPVSVDGYVPTPGSGEENTPQFQIINEDGVQFLATNDDPPLPSDLFGKPLPDGAVRLLINKDGFVVNENGKFVNASGVVIEGEEYVIKLGDNGLPYRVNQQGEQIYFDRTSKPIDAVSLANYVRSLETTGKLLGPDGEVVYTAPLSHPYLPEPEANADPAGVDFSGLGALFAEENIDDVYQNGFRMIITDEEGNLVEFSETLEGLVGESGAAVLRFIRFELEFERDAAGNIIYDSDGNPVRRSWEEIIVLLEQSPELRQRVLYGDTTVQQLLDDGRLEAAISLNSYLTDVMHFLVAVKQVLQDLQAMTAGTLKQRRLTHMALVDDLIAKLDLVRTKNEEITLELREADNKGDCAAIANIVMAIAGALLTVIMAVATVLTGGAASPGVIAAVLLMVTITTLSTLEAAGVNTVVMGAVFGGIMKALSFVLKAVISLAFMGGAGLLYGPEKLNKIMDGISKVLAVIVLVIIIIVLNKGSGLKAAVDGASKAVQTSAKVSMMTRSLILATTIQYSNVMYEAVLNFGEARLIEKYDLDPDSPNYQEKLESLDEYQDLIVAASIIQGVVLVMASMASVSGLAKAMSEVGMSSQATARLMKGLYALEVLMGLAHAGTNVAQSVSAFRIRDAFNRAAELQLDVAEIEMQITIIKDLLLKLMGLDEESLKEYMEGLSQEISALADSFTKIVGSLQRMGGIFTALFG